MEDSTQCSLDISFGDLSQREKRALMFHLFYTADSHDYEDSLAAIVDQYNRGFGLDIPLDSDLVKNLDEVISQRTKLDEAYKPLLTNWRFDRIGISTKLILRYAAWELIHTDTDPIIVINEAIELAKCFAERDAYKFINGILDQLAKREGKHVEKSAIEE
jgi:N utilization substance protein B